MKIQISRKYLVFPVSTYVSEKLLTLSADSGEEYKLNVRLDNISPDFDAYVDVSQFIGQEIFVSSDPQMDIHFKESADGDLPAFVGQQVRPELALAHQQHTQTLRAAIMEHAAAFESL